MISVVVPFSPGDPARDRNWTWVRARYAHVYPEWEVVERDDPEPGWSKGRAVRTAVNDSTGNVLVIADADVFVGANFLRAAVHLVEHGVPWVMPHDVVYRLSDVQTINLTSRPPDIEPEPLPLRMLERRKHRAPNGGGIVVLTRTAFETVGGIDPRFTGWGGEDISFGRALDTLVGPHHTLNAPMWHLHHPRMERREGNRASPMNEALAGAYKDAAGDPARMAELVKDG